MITGKTTSGFEFAISEDALNDWELVEDIVAVDNGDPTKTISLARRLLEGDGYAALKEHCRDKVTGRVKADLMSGEILSILTAANEGKN